LVCRRKLAQRLRTGTVASDSDRTNLDIVKHRVEQRCSASRSRDLKRIQDAVFEDIDRVEFLGGSKFGSFTADIAHFQCQVLDELLLDRQIPVLDVRDNTVIGEALQSSFAIRHRNRLERLDAAGWQWESGQGRLN